MSTAELIDQIFKVVNEAILLIFAAIALWLTHVARQWMAGKLDVPPHEHQVIMKDERKP